jgi:dTDP-4-dehydrorhamnose reductase
MMHENAKILVLGSNGQLGKELQKISLQFPDFIFIFTDKLTIDISNPNCVSKIIYYNPDYIINCAAYTAVDKAESELSSANNLNHLACRWIIEGAEKTNSILLHLSSDYVYNFNSGKPLLETDRCSPNGVYAITKLDGEQTVRSYPKHIILRTSWVFGNEGKNFYKSMLALSQKPELKIVSDQYGAPTYALDLAIICLKIIEKLENAEDDSSLFGTFNFSNEGCITWYDFAKQIFEFHKVNISLTKTTTREFNASAPRPQWSVLSKQKLKNIYKINVPHWYDALKRCVNENMEISKKY